LPPTRRPISADAGRWSIAGLAAAGLFAALSCAARAAPSPSAGPACAVGDTVLVRETLYFGRNRPGGGTVADAEWNNFLKQVLTPQFPAGFTVTDAIGQWRGESGVVEQEQSHVVTIYHAGDAASRRAISEVALEYKRRFGQEAVLRERTSTCGAFE
jgi:hypothetical protein